MNQKPHDESSLAEPPDYLHQHKSDQIFLAFESLIARWHIDGFDLRHL